MNKVLWVFLFLFNMYLSCGSSGMINDNILRGFIILSFIVVFYFRSFSQKNIILLALLLFSSSLTAAYVVRWDPKAVSSVITILLLIYVIFLVPLSIIKRINSNNKRLWVVMPISAIICFCLEIGSNSLPNSLWFPYYATLEYGCVISFFYVILQYCSLYIKKCLEE